MSELCGYCTDPEGTRRGKEGEGEWEKKRKMKKRKQRSFAFEKDQKIGKRCRVPTFQRITVAGALRARGRSVRSLVYLSLLFLIRCPAFLINPLRFSVAFTAHTTHWSARTSVKKHGAEEVSVTII